MAPTKPRVYVEVKGHRDVRVLNENGGWQVHCECDKVVQVRSSVEEAQADRFEHEEKIGAYKKP